MGLGKWLYDLLTRSGDDNLGFEEKVEETTKHVTRDFWTYRATVYFEDDFKKVEYNNASYHGDILELYDHGEDDFEVNAYGPQFSDGVEPRRINLDKVEDMQIDWSMELTAVSEVPATVYYKRDITPDDQEDNEWEEVHTTLHTAEENDVEIWEALEWDVKQERENNE